MGGGELLLVALFVLIWVALIGMTVYSIAFA